MSSTFSTIGSIIDPTHKSTSNVFGRVVNDTKTIASSVVDTAKDVGISSAETLAKMVDPKAIADGSAKLTESVLDNTVDLIKSTNKSLTSVFKDLNDTITSNASPEAIFNKATDLTNSTFKAINNTRDIVVADLKDKTLQEFNRLKSTIVDSLDLSRTVIAGFKYSDVLAIGDKLAKVKSSVESVVGEGVSSISTQIPKPFLPTKSLSNKLKSEKINLPNFIESPDYRRMGLDADYWWGVDLVNTNPSMTDKSAIPENPYKDFNFNTAGVGYGKYIPIDSYEVKWRTESPDQLSVGPCTIQIPNKIQFPETLTMHVHDTDKRIWDLYLRKYYAAYYGFRDVLEDSKYRYEYDLHEFVPIPYKEACSTIGVNIFYYDGSRNLRTEFYAIPKFEFDYNGEFSKSAKDLTIVWNIYGEKTRYYYSLDESY